MSNAKWIWYPDDFEIVLSNKFMSKRYERDVFIPPFWKQFNCYSNVKFVKEVSLAREEVIAIKCEGLFNVEMDGAYVYNLNGRLTVPAGSHRIVASVYNDKGLPCLYAEGQTVFSDGSWQVTCNDHVTRAAACDEDFLGDLTPNTFRLPEEELLPVDSFADGDRVVYDFGREIFARIRLKNAKGTLTAYYGESVEEVCDRECCELISTDFESKGGYSETTVTKAFRYVSVEGEFDGISAMFEYLPIESKSSFKCANQRLNDIYAVAEYTLFLNSREFLIDGIKRDRWVWCADALQSNLMHYYSFFDKGSVKRTLISLFGKSPFGVYINHIMDYTFMWILSVGDYLSYTGDEGFVKDNVGKVFEIMDYCLGRRDENGLMDSRPSDWVFVDWAEGLDNTGEVCFEQILLVAALRECVRLSEKFGFMQQAERYGRILAETEPKLEAYWSEEKKAYVYSIRDGQPDGVVFRQPNVFAVLFDICDDKRKREIEENVLKNDAIPAITTPYMRFFELSALGQLGETEYVLNEIIEYWGGMLDEGATTFWEKYDSTQKGPEKYAMYGRKYGKSLCHAWGASPLYLIGKYVLGLTHEGDEGRYVLKPCLEALGDVEATLPLANGSVSISYKDGRLKVLSEEASGRVEWKGRIYELKAKEILEV